MKLIALVISLKQMARIPPLAMMRAPDPLLAERVF